jgi:hypothetical protein
MATRTSTAKPSTAKAAADAKATDAPVLVTLDLVRDKETPGTFRFAEVVEEGKTPVVGTVYLRKSELDGKAPSAIRVTVQDLSA